MLPLQAKSSENMMKRLFFFMLSALTFAACQESIEERAARDAREVTEKKCPMPIGDEGRVILERVEFDIPSLTWKEDMLLDLSEGSELNYTEIKQVLLNELKNTPSYKPYMTNGFNFQYIYCRMSNPKDTLINLTLTKADYQ